MQRLETPTAPRSRAGPDRGSSPPPGPAAFSARPRRLRALLRTVSGGSRGPRAVRAAVVPAQGAFPSLPRHLPAAVSGGGDPPWRLAGTVTLRTAPRRLSPAEEVPRGRGRAALRVHRGRARAPAGGPSGRAPRWTQTRELTRHEGHGAPRRPSRAGPAVTPPTRSPAALPPGGSRLRTPPRNFAPAPRAPLAASPAEESPEMPGQGAAAAPHQHGARPAAAASPGGAAGRSQVFSKTLLSFHIER